MTLVYLAVAWFVGLVAGRAWALPIWTMAILGIAGLLAGVWPGDRRRRLAGGLLVVGLAGVLRYRIAESPPTSADLAYYNDRGQVFVEGYVSAEPSDRGAYAQIEIQAESLDLDGVVHAASGKALVNVPVYPAYQYGDRVRIRADLETPPMLDDFDYREYLASKGVHSLLRRASVRRLPGTEGSTVLRWMYARKGELRDVIERILPGAEAGLLSGILLGLSHTLPDDLYDAYRAAGLTHIIVISGFNIGLVAQAVMLVSRRLARRWLVLVGSLVVIAAYTVFVGPSAPVVRATIMIGIALLGQIAGRKSHALTSLAVASWAMTAAQPLMLWSVSFQLSCAATLALVLLEPRLSQAAAALLEAKAPGRASWLPFLRDTLIATVAAQLATMPIIWYHFQELSVVALLANLLALPVQPAILMLGALATALGAIWLPAGKAAAWMVWPFLRWTNQVVAYLGAPSWASVTLPQVAASWFWAGLAIIAAVYWAWRSGLRLSRVRKTWRAGLVMAAAAIVAIVIWLGAMRAPDGKLHVRMLDIGQGDAILITTPSGRRILVDGGPDPVALSAQLGQALPLWSRRIDLVVATHSDADHIGGLLALDQYRCGQVIESPTMSDSALYQAWRGVVSESNVACMAAARGQRIEIDDGVAIDVIHPDAGLDTGLDDNQSSVVLALRYGNFSLLLTGDIDEDIEELLVRRGAVAPATVLKVAHHGALNATSDAWLSSIQPQIALVSAGIDNRFGHPCQEMLARLDQRDCLILRTDQQGACELVTDGQQMWCLPQRPKKRIR